MPVFVLQPPSLPPLQTYIALSCLSLAWCFLYARDALETVEHAGLTNPVLGAKETSETTRGDGGAAKWYGGANESERPRYLFGIQDDDSEIVKLCRIMMADVWSVLALINLAFCILILLWRLVQLIVFGDLRANERQHLRDKLWKFIFYKFIIIFGVLNVQTLEEMVVWMAWFAVLAFLYSLSGLCKDRFEYLSFSPSSMSWAHGKVLCLLLTIVGLCQGMILLSCYMGALGDWNILLFTVSEVFILELRAIYIVIRYGIHFYDLRHEGVWERRGSIMYYTDLIVELMALGVDFAHHFHMLLWGNVFLSMASLVICMELRYLYSEIQRRIKRHRNYRQVVQNMQAKFPLATDEELRENNDECAICWEEMNCARKLPCNHLFHNTCLRSWLEHETSCPTCRHTLNIRGDDERPNQPPAPTEAPVVGPGLMDEAQPVRPRRRMGHFFHFDGSRIASWIPSFSVEVSHRHLLQRRAANRNSQLNNMATQVQQMFPDFPLSVLIEDLRITRSVETTVDNILEERLVAPPVHDSIDPDNTNLQENDVIQSQPSPPHSARPALSANPATNVDPDTRQAEQPPLYDAPGRSTIVDSIRQFASSEQVVEGMHEREGLPGGGGLVHGGGDAPYVGRDSTRELQADEPVNFREEEGGPQALPARFSKSSVEREVILKQRKDLLLQQARRRFQHRQTRAASPAVATPTVSASSQSASSPITSLSANQNPSSRDAVLIAPSTDHDERNRRRAAAYEAALRRMSQHQQ